MAIVYTIAISIIAGVAVSALFTFHVGLLSTVLLTTLLILILRRSHLSRVRLLLCTVVFFFTVAMLPLYITEAKFDTYGDDFGKECIIHGRISEIRETDEPGRVRATVRLLKLKNSTCTASRFYGKSIYVYADKSKFKNAVPGNEVIMHGSFVLPEPAMNPGAFNARRYYMSINIAGFCYDPDSVSIYPGYFYPPGVLHKIQNFSQSALQKYIGGEGADFVTAVLLGDRSGFSDRLTENIRKVGISHVTAVSGMHVSILITLILLLTNPFTKRRKIKARIVFAVLLFYVALSGFSPSVIRATVMGCCCMAGVLSGRRSRPLLLLVLCASVMLTANPFLLYSPSFMLSFLSSAGLSVFTPVIKNKLRTSSAIADTLLTTVIANIATLPYVLWNFDYYSWLGLISNILIVPLISWVFIGGFITVVLSPLPFLSSVAGTFTGGICSIILSVTSAGADLPFGQLYLRLNNTFYLLAMLTFIALIYFILKNKHRVTALLCALSVLFMLTGLCADFISREPFKVTYLYVGQGDSAVVQLPGGAIFLIDAGDVTSSGSSPCLDFLNSTGVNIIEGIILSHEDADHAGALEAIVSEIPTKNIYISRNCLLNRKPDSIKSIASRYGCTLTAVEGGDSLSVNGNVTFDFLYPSPHTGFENSNDNSLVARLSYNGKSFLFTGDISHETEVLISPLLTDCHVLKIPHHGAATSCSEVLLSKTSPEFAVISAGIRNSYSHPGTSTTTRLAWRRIKTLITFRHGAVSFKVSKNGQLTCETHIKPERR